MALAELYRHYNDELTCDMAEFYRITNMRGLPVRTLATLALGLPKNSRIAMKTLGRDPFNEGLLLAAIADRLAILIWQNTGDAQKGRNMPKLILSELTEEKDKISAFTSGADFEAARDNILKGGNS